MDFKKIKDSLIYVIDKGAPLKIVVEELVTDSFNLFVDSNIKPTEDEINETIDKLLSSEELVYDPVDGWLYVTAFSPRTASKITEKKYY